MRNLLMITLVLSLTMNVSACSPDDSPLSSEIPETEQPDNKGKEDPENKEENKNMKFTVRIGSKTFTATLANNETAKAFRAVLPMTIEMSELSNNEKYYYLPSSLPTISSRPDTINNGDIMLYGSNCLVVFYKTFSTSYSYSRIGTVDNPSQFQSALGTGSVTVVFEQLSNE